MLVVIDGSKSFRLDQHDHLTIGRIDDPSGRIAGLDPLDRGISRRALGFEHTAAGWIAHNLSSSQPVYIERVGGGALRPLPPGAQHLVDGSTLAMEVRGRILVHRVDVRVDETARHAFPNPQPSGPVTISEAVEITDAERIAVAALFRGYLEHFPRRDCLPISYETAAASVGLSPTTIRRRIERLRTRLRRDGVYIEGPAAKFELASYLLDRGLIGPDDLLLLERTHLRPGERQRE